jgi:iron complex outermembrane receptor protein
VKTNFVLLCAGLLTTLYTNGQPITLTGHVTSKKTGIESATVTAADTLGSYTETTGKYTLMLPASGKYLLKYSAIGYENSRLTVYLTRDTVIDVELYEINARLNEVVVTGVTRATSMRRNPVPMAVLGRQEMEKNSSTNIIDAIARGVPGVSTVTTGPNISKPFIRGLGYYRVLTMYDGIRQEGQQWGDEHGIEVDDAGIDRAEIVKGPASLIYGSDATAGVINLIPWVPKKNQQGWKGDVQTSVQSNNGMAALSAGAGYRKNDWYMAARISGKTAHDYQNAADGYVYNTGYTERNATVTTGLERNWGFTRLAMTIYDNMQEIPDGTRDSASRAFTRQQDEPSVDDVKLRPVVPAGEFTRYNIADIHQHIQHYRLYSHNQFTTAAYGIFSLSLGAQQSHRMEFNHPRYPQQAALNVLLNTGTYDLRWALPARKHTEASVGINGMYQTNKSINATDFPIPDYRLFDVGAFVFAKKTLGKLDISGGVRMDKRYIQWADFYVATDPATGMGMHTEHSANLQFPAFNHEYEGISGSAGASYLASKWLIAKLNIARGYRAPNVTETGSNGLDPGAHIVYLGNRSFSPEFSLQQDAGLTFTFTNWDATVEVFNNNIDNYIYQARLLDASGQPVVIVPGNTTYQYRQSAARIAGGEVLLNLHPARWKWLAISGNISYTDGVSKDAAMLQTYGQAGKYLPLIAPLQCKGSIRISPAPDKGVFCRPYAQAQIQYSARQNHYLAADNTETATAAYTLLNIGAGTALQNKNKREWIRIHIQADNLLDVVYQSHLSRLKYFEYYNRLPGERSGISNMGRNLSLKVIVPFGR